MNINSYLENVDKALGRTASVSFFGMGKSNLSLLSRLDSKGRRIVVRSDKAVARTRTDVEYITGEAARRGICEDVLILSPSVRRERLDVSGSTALTSDIEIFFSGEKKHCFCISGSDGKSTTTALTALLLSTNLDTVCTVGNIGIPYASVDESERLTYVCELSSFNLRYFSPPSERCLLTNITPNHLDFHEDFAEYRDAKLAIARAAERVVLNADCPECMRLAAMRRPFALFSAKQGREALLRDYAPEHTICLCGGSILLDGDAVARAESIRSLAPHDVKNAMGAIALCAELCDRAAIEDVLHGFSGLPHRCTVIGESRGVRYIDSSIDTTPSRTAATLSAISRPVHLILGGRGKGLSLEPMRDALSKRVRRISVYSEARDAICEWLDGTPELRDIPRGSFASFEDAVIHASAGAPSGTAVLLSPAHTSYGEFLDFAERGDAFAEIVKKKILI